MILGECPRVCDECYDETGDCYDVCIDCDPDDKQAAIRSLERTAKALRRWCVPGRMLVVARPIYDAPNVVVAVRRGKRRSSDVLRDLGSEWPQDVPYKKVILQAYRLRSGNDTAFCYAADRDEIDDMLRSLERAPAQRGGRWPLTPNGAAPPRHPSPLTNAIPGEPEGE